MSFLPVDFSVFTAHGTDRYNVLCSILKKRNIDFSTVTIDTKKHIFINFPRSAYNPLFTIKTVLIHYDRTENTPGANDNSAAVFQALDWIERLNAGMEQHNIRLFFTDGEELGSLSPDSCSQGAYGIASRFKHLGIDTGDVIVCDGCGRGEVLAVSTAGRLSAQNIHFRQRFDSLYERLISIAKNAAPESWITIPVPYSDNAGFIACGIPACAVTVLPKEEATQYMRSLQKDKKFEKEVMTHSCSNSSRLPLTWQMMHTADDSIENLTPVSFTLMHKFFDLLAKNKTIS